MEGGLGAQLHSPPSAAATAATRSLISKGSGCSPSVQTCKPAFQAQSGLLSSAPCEEAKEACHPRAQKLCPQLQVSGVLGQTLGYLRTICFGDGHYRRGQASVWPVE